MFKKMISTILASIFVVGMVSGCAQSSTPSGEKEVKIGYFPNLTHSSTIIALEKGYFKEAFGADVQIQTKTVANGGLFMEAMATKAIDVGTVGPGPLLNFYVKHPGYRLISGAVNGGAVLVMNGSSNITKLEDLKGKKIAIPVIGSTQDVMLRKALNDVGLKPTTNGGDVELYAAAPADTAALFVQKSIDGAATQEPWGYVLESKAEGKLLLDWDQFAWGKESTNTVVAASDEFLKKEGLAKAYLQAHKKAVKFIQDHPEESQQLIIKHLKDLTGKELSKKEVQAAFSRLEVTTAVNEKVIQEMADISKEAGYITSNKIDGLIDLKYLEEAN
ncbi:ABC transporter substrate-binding protein [Brevibacillus sp. 179-C9.3 HS]|uniref:ABC transporter substrate-binding protein n=1 Tax=unclassified Brevibacillus TaxID=2684853 RepID=UPI00399FC91E